MAVNGKSQECFKYFLEKKGTSVEYSNFDKKGNLTSINIRTVIDKKINADNVEVRYRIESKSVESDTTITSEFSAYCSNGVITIDMSDYFAGVDTSAYKDMEIEVTGDNVEFPSNPTAGQQLNDAQMTIVIKNNGTAFMTIESQITNRKVEAVENITTSAGTFETVKLSYDVNVKMGFITTQAKANEWYNEKYGLIKSESYDKKGKLESYTELTNILND